MPCRASVGPVQIAVVAGKLQSAEVAIVRVKYSAVHILLFVLYDKCILRSFSWSDVYTPCPPQKMHIFAYNYI